MAVAHPERWSGSVIPARPETPGADGLKQAVELMAAHVGRAIRHFVDPPYPTPDGKPLEIHFYKPGESTFTPKQMEQLAAIVRMFEGKTAKG